MYQSAVKNLTKKSGYLRSHVPTCSVSYINASPNCYDTRLKHRTHESHIHPHYCQRRFSTFPVKKCITSLKDKRKVIHARDSYGYTPLPIMYFSIRNNNFSNLMLYPRLSINLDQRYSFHVSSVLQQDPKDEFKVLDEKNRVEEYVEHQKEKLERKRRIMGASAKFQEAFIFKVDKSLLPDGPILEGTARPATVKIKKPIVTKIIDEVKHYYKGFKLLYLDTKIAARLLWSVMNGNALSRRERKQFLRTAADLFRLVPFMVFLIIPFMEFLLPVAIKFFPGMLPSTFEDAKTKANKRRLSLKMRLQMAEFLQDTIEEISVSSLNKGKKPNQKLVEFAEFVKKTRTDSNPPSNEEIMKYSKLFEDEITLDNIPHDQLKALCRVMMISPIGTNNFLRFKIRLKLQELNADDKIIRREGIDNLSNEELQQACIARGMRALGVSVDRMKSNLKQWLDLSLDQKIPASLLILSRIFYMQTSINVDQQLKVTISQLPERLIDEMEVKIGAVEGESVDRQTIIDIIKHEEEQIKAEKLEKDKVKIEEEKQRQIELLEPLVTLKEDQFSKEEILKVKETLSSDREELLKLKVERNEYIEDVQELKQVKKAVESVASTRLGKRIDSILQKVDSSLKKLEEGVSKLPVGKLDEDQDGVVTTQELSDVIRKLRDAPDEAKTKRLLEVMDVDKDGVIDLEEMRMAIKLLATEDLHLNESQIGEVLSLLKNTEKIFVLEQMLNKRKTNYIIRLLPHVYSRKHLDDVL